MIDDDDDLFDDTTLSSPSNTLTGTKNQIAIEMPPIGSVDWNDKVMSLFEEDELVDGRPVVHGLKRVAELLFGEIVLSGPVQVFPPQTDAHVGRATVVYRVRFDSGREFSEVADCWEQNTDDAFCAFATATASTRALGRALRQALRIRTVAAEEMTKKDTAAFVKSTPKPVTATTGEYDDKARMTDKQSKFLAAKCKQVDVNVSRLFQDVFDTDPKRLIKKSVASDAIDKVNTYQQDPSTIPKSILGYKENWSNAE